MQKFSNSADVKAAVAAQAPYIRSTLEDLVRIPSISGDAFDPSTLTTSAEAVAQYCRDLGLPEVEILTADKPDGTPGAPAVVARRPAPAGKPTVLLYAHHDVQPTGDEALWDSPSFEPTERNGRLYGRGTADDKAGVVAHLGALKALLPTWGETDGVGVTVFIEGEEEIGSPSFGNFLRTYREKLTADVIIVADADNWTVDIPALTTSLRGMVDITVTAKTLAFAQHSGMNGGAVPDALMALTVLLAKLWDEKGDLAVPNLHRGEAAELDYTEERLRQDTGLLPGVQTVGDGSLLARRWTRPAVTIIGMDVPNIAEASNTLHPEAAAKLSLRVAPGQDAVEAYQAVHDYLMAAVPYGAQVSIEMGEAGRAFDGQTDHPVYAKACAALKDAWDGADAVFQGMGGSIPLIPELQEVFPDATILVTGVEDADTRAHGANESVHLAMFHRAVTAEALLLHDLAETGLGI